MKKFVKLLSVITAAVLICSVIFTMNVHAAEINYKPLFKSGTYSDSADINASLYYSLYVPEDYDETKSYPIVLFLHGAAERNLGSSAQLSNSPFMKNYFTEENMEKYPCIVLQPQCPNNLTWVEAIAGDNWQNSTYKLDDYNESAYIKLVMGLLGKIEEEYNVDRTRRYITGISMGGYGTWATSMYHADVFAAAIPNCGGNDPTQAEKLAGLPIWTFHGDADGTVNLNGTRGMYENMLALSENNPDMKVLKYVETTDNLGTEQWEDIKDATFIYTEYTGVGHSCAVYSYTEPYIFEWMFSKTNPDAADVTNNAKCGKNYAYYGTVFDDGYGEYLNAKSTPAAAVDGSYASQWQYASKPAEEVYLGVKWNNAKAVDKAVIYWGKAYRALASTDGYTVQYTLDGESWEDVKNANYEYSTLKGGTNKDVVTFDEVEAKAIRILIKSMVNANAGPRIFEFDIYNTSEAVKNGSIGVPTGDTEEGGDDDQNPPVPPKPIEGENIAAQGTGFDNGGTHGNVSSPANLNDGDASTYWQYLTEGNSYPFYAGIEFAEETAVNAMKLYWENGTRAVADKTGYTVEYSLDGEAWNEVPEADYAYGGENTEDAVAQDDITFEQVTAKFFRVNILSGTNNKYFPKLFEIEIYNMTDSEDNKDEAYGLSFNADEGIVTGILPSTAANAYPTLTVKNAKGETVADDTKIGTGFTVTYNNREYTVLIKGDVSGDGNINSSDFMQVRRKFLGLFEIEGIKSAAADVNSDGKINSTDYMQIRSHFLGRTNLFA